MTWGKRVIFTMPVNFRPKFSTITGIMFNPYRTTAVMIRSNGDVSIDQDELPDGYTAKQVACVAAGNIIGRSKELQEFLYAKELPQVPVEPPVTGSWLIFIKYTKKPVRLCESEEQTDLFIDGNVTQLGKIFWQHGKSWFTICQEINRGNRMY
jgi:hypothetical protein